MLKDCEWSVDRDYKSGSDNEPLQFYLEGLANSNEFSLLLGYFSSSAINLLSMGFATFISNGGKMRMVINHLLSAKDKETIAKVEDNQSEIRVFDLTDSESLERILDNYDSHFFECLTYLISAKRIEIKIIKPKNGRGIAHYKSGLFSDGKHTVGYQASCNFTYFGLAENIEQLEAYLSWENGRSNKFINKQIKLIEDYFTENDKDVEYISASEIEVVLKKKFGNKNIEELLVQEKKLLEHKERLISSNLNIKKTISNILEKNEINRNNPKFPYHEGPREYQKTAYKNWVENNRQGLFAMATGTGKTLTSLNCVLEEFKLTNAYKFIVLVPTNALATQWVEESKEKFNYQNTILCSSGNKNWKTEIKQLGKNILFGRNSNFAIITTYATFKGIKFQSMFNEYFISEFNNMILIADEAHNFGAPGFLKVIPHYFNKRIGLSATPERQFDDNGNKLLNEFFSCSEEEYTFEYNMKTAIENRILCKYKYYPVIVNLEIDEQENYLKISNELLKYIDPETGKYKESDYVSNLLIKRKNIIHKAKNKLSALISIINTIGKDNFKKAFIYVPEGIEAEYTTKDFTTEQSDNEIHSIIDKYIIALYEHFHIKMAKFTGETNNREQILNQFKLGKLDALLAMKCLDEGVDIPQTQYAIFCSSTGNPRQYIQRRGRVLRMHTAKEYAVIYDLIVKPTISHTNTDEKLRKMEINIFLSELRRLVNFAVLSENKDQCLGDLEFLCNDLDIDIYKLANLELENYK
jgi:superfamily II DNA or RNA helicase